MGEKKMDAFSEEYRAFLEQPELTPEAQIEADSFTGSAAEQLDELKAAGYPVPEKQPGVKVALSDAFGGIEQGFNTAAELTPEAQLEADSYVEPFAEQLDELKKAGIPVPEQKPGRKLDLPDAFGGIEQGFNAQADLAPEAQIEAGSYIEPFTEQLDELKEAGIPVPEQKPGRKLDLPDAFGGIEQGFNTEAKLSPEAEIEAESYIVSGKESVDEAKEILKK